MISVTKPPGKHRQAVILQSVSARWILGLKIPSLSPWSERLGRGDVRSFFHLVGGERQGYAAT
jgi:hypothetical protein